MQLLLFKHSYRMYHFYRIPLIFFFFFLLGYYSICLWKDSWIPVCFMSTSFFFFCPYGFSLQTSVPPTPILLFFQWPPPNLTLAVWITKINKTIKVIWNFLKKRNNILITTDMPVWSSYPPLWQFSLETTLLHFSNFITIWLRDCYFALATDFISCPVHLCPRYTCEMTSSVSACQ